MTPAAGNVIGSGVGSLTGDGLTSVGGGFSPGPLPAAEGGKPNMKEILDRFQQISGKIQNTGTTEDDGQQAAQAAQAGQALQASNAALNAQLAKMRQGGPFQAVSNMRKPRRQFGDLFF
jgi:hypothetical protein